MLKPSTSLSIVSLLGSFIFAATSAFAMNAGMNKTPILTFTSITNNDLAQVVGYPNGKPTLMLYTNHLSGKQLISVDADSLVPRTINIDLSLPNTEKDLKLKNNADMNVQSIDQIIWFNNSYYALVVGSSEKTQQSTTAILESNDGKEWNVIKQWPWLEKNESGNKVENEHTDDLVLVGSGSSSNPTLVVVHEGEFYYKHLNDKNTDWQNSHVRSYAAGTTIPHLTHILPYNEGFLADSEETDETQNKITVKLLFSKDGETWVKLSQPQEKFAYMFFTAGDKLFAHITNNTKQNASSSEDSISVTEDTLPTGDLGEMNIDFTKNSLTINNAVPLKPLRCKGCTYQNQPYTVFDVKDVIYSPASASYYWIFNGSDAFPKFHQLSWAKVDSLQSLAQKPELLPVNSENEGIDFDTDNGFYKSLIIFNDKPYMLASVKDEKDGSASTVLFQINE